MNESDIVRVTRYRLGLHSRIHPYPKVASEFLFPPSVTGARIKGQGARSQPSFTTRKLLGPLVHYRGCSHHNFLPFYSRVCSPIKYLNASPKSWPRAPMTTFPPPPPRPFHPPAHALHTWKSPPNPSTRISTAIRSRITICRGRLFSTRESSGTLLHTYPWLLGEDCILCRDCQE